MGCVRTNLHADGKWATLVLRLASAQVHIRLWLPTSVIPNKSRGSLFQKDGGKEEKRRKQLMT